MRRHLFTRRARGGVGALRSRLAAVVQLGALLAEELLELLGDLLGELVARGGELLAALAHPLHQLAQPLDVVAVTGVEALAEQPPERRGEVPVVQEVVAEGGEDVVAVEGVGLLASVKAREAPGAGGHGSLPQRAR